jgi:phosphohistidine phosphatase
MRHAAAAAGDGRDHSRPLTGSGNEQAIRVGAWLVREGLRPDRALSSSAIRCRETWQALCTGLGSDPPVEFEDRLYNAAVQSLFEALTDPATFLDAPPEADEAPSAHFETRFLLAHNPGISRLALELVRDPEDMSRLRAGFAPATLACFEISRPWSELSPRSARLTHLQNAFDL